MPHSTQQHIEAKLESEQRYFSTRMPRIRAARSANFLPFYTSILLKGRTKSKKNFQYN
jgi:hypothetical protein